MKDKSIEKYINEYGEGLSELEKQRIETLVFLFTDHLMMIGMHSAAVDSDVNKESDQAEKDINDAANTFFTNKESKEVFKKTLSSFTSEIMNGLGA